MQARRKFAAAPFIAALLSISSHAFAQFTGSWDIDMRKPDEVARDADCGRAGFVLHQSGQRISGEHHFVTSGCGRMNEGGVVGIAIDDSRAVLAVTSSRNNAVALGTARLLQDNRLAWETVEMVVDTLGDSPLILGKGLLSPARTTVRDEALETRQSADGEDVDDPCTDTGSSLGAAMCTASRTDAAEHALQKAEDAHDAWLIGRSNNPPHATQAARDERAAWRAYRDARCTLEGERDGGSDGWKNVWDAECRLAMTLARTTALGAAVAERSYEGDR